MRQTPQKGADREPTIAEQAARWWVTLHSGEPEPHDRSDFADWAARSPQHVAAYLKLARAIRAVRQSDVRWPTIPTDVLIAQARQEAPGPVPIDRTQYATAVVPRRAPWPWARLAAGIVVMCAVSAGLLAWWHGSADHYVTGIGEQRSVALEDGSIVTLNTSSEIKVLFSKRHREVRLISGEALFQVAHDAARPFDVAAGTATVRAVGTEFNIDRHNADTTVTVVEGRVSVTPDSDSQDGASSRSAAVLDASEKLVIAHGTMGARQTVSNVSPTLAWTQRQLVFDKSPLGTVAAEFNRYNQRRIEIRAAGLAREPLTGIFQANNPQAFLTFLSHLPGVRIVTDAHSAIVTQD